MTRIAIIIGSIRPERRGDQVARWVRDIAHERGDALYEIVDLAAFDLPLLDEPVPAAVSGDYRHEHTRTWSRAIAPFDGYLFVTPEYNHGSPASLKNAVDYLFSEWNNKAAAFVSYGINGGVRSVEQLRMVLNEVQMSVTRTQVALSLFHDFDIGEKTDRGTFQPEKHNEVGLHRVLDELVGLAGALAPRRTVADSAGTGAP